MDFHFEIPENIEIDQIIDFLFDLKEEKQRNWRTVKIYVAGLRWYYQHVANDVETAKLIPIPKRKEHCPVLLAGKN